MAQHLVERYGDRLHGVLSCYDRIVVTGTLPQACYAAGMTSFADGLKPEQLHKVLDRYARLCCPLAKTFAQRYHWSLMQVEYATDLVAAVK